MTTPSIGRIVIYRCDEVPINGTTEHPAVITRVWSPTCVNLTVFFDACAPGCVTSVVQIDGQSSEGGGWFWPPKVE